MLYTHACHHIICILTAYTLPPCRCTIIYYVACLHDTIYYMNTALCMLLYYILCIVACMHTYHCITILWYTMLTMLSLHYMYTPTVLPLYYVYAMLQARLPLCYIMHCIHVLLCCMDTRAPVLHVHICVACTPYPCTILLCCHCRYIYCVLPLY